MEEVLEEYEHQIESFTLIPSEGGRFEFQVDGDLLYSKLKTWRHVEPGEINKLLKEHLEK